MIPAGWLGRKMSTQTKYTQFSECWRQFILPNVFGWVSLVKVYYCRRQFTLGGVVLLKAASDCRRQLIVRYIRVHVHLWLGHSDSSLLLRKAIYTCKCRTYCWNRFLSRLLFAWRDIGIRFSVLSSVHSYRICVNPHVQVHFPRTIRATVMIIGISLPRLKCVKMLQNTNTTNCFTVEIGLFFLGWPFGRMVKAANLSCFELLFISPLWV